MSSQRDAPRRAPTPDRLQPDSRSAAVARHLIRRAAQQVPAAVSARLEEEWLADLATRTGSLSRLRLALGCCWAARVIGAEHAAWGVVAAGTTSPKVLTARAPVDLSFVSGRTLALLTIACIHIAVLYSLATGLMQRTITPEPAMQVSFPTEIEVAPRAPAANNAPSHAHPRLRSPAPKVDIEPPVSAELPPPPAVAPQAADRNSVPPPPASTRVLGGPGVGFPATEDFYPAAARRLGEKGAATVQVCVDVTGQLNAAPLLAASSGSARLDEGALRLARAGSGHYRPTIEDGRAVNSCYPIRVRFELRN
jgi:TonB family protein